MFRFLLLLPILGLLACGGLSSNQSNTAGSLGSTASDAAVDPSDPAKVKESFEARIKLDLDKITPRLQEEIISGDNKYYAKALGTYSYDIQQTDSIVTPFSGVAKYDVDWFANDSQTSGSTYIQANYSFQDGKWILSEAFRVIKSSEFPDEPALNGPVLGGTSVAGPQWAMALFN